MSDEMTITLMDGTKHKFWKASTFNEGEDYVVFATNPLRELARFKKDDVVRIEMIYGPKP